MSLRAKIEAIVYVAEEPVTVDQILEVVADDLSAELAKPAEGSLPIEETADRSQPDEILADAKQEAKQQRERSRRRVREECSDSREGDASASRQCVQYI